MSESVPVSRRDDPQRISWRIEWLAIALGNGVVVALYFVFDLTPLGLVFVLWWECVWVVLFSWLKILVMALFGRPFDTRRVGFSRGAAIVLGAVLLGAVAGKYLALLSFIALGVTIVSMEILDVSGSTLLWQLAGTVGVAFWLMLGHLTGFVTHFLIAGDFRTARGLGTLAWSYARCAVLALGMIAGLVWAASVPAYADLFAPIIVIVKLAGDFVLTRGQYRPPGRGSDMAADAWEIQA